MHMTETRGHHTADAQQFRKVLGHYPTGVAFVSGVGADGLPVGMVVGSFTSASLDPPLVAFFPSRSSSTFPRLCESETFVVNVLAADQEELCRKFAQKNAVDKWDGVSWHPTTTGAPVLDGAVAWMECDLENQFEVGDHSIVLGRVRELEVGDGGLPLLFFQGGYGRFTPRSLVIRPDAQLLPAIRLADLARGEMERVASDTGLECLALTCVGEEQLVVASAGAPGGDRTPTRAGVRLPFAAPLGSVFAAWAGDTDVTGWLNRSLWSPSECSSDDHLRALDRVRQRGWSLVLSPYSSNVHQAMDAFGDDVGTAHDAPLGESLGRALGKAGGQYEPDILPTADLWDVRSLAVPVFGANGTVDLALRLHRLPRRMDQAAFTRLLSRLTEAADAIMRIAHIANTPTTEDGGRECSGGESREQTGSLDERTDV